MYGFNSFYLMFPANIMIFIFVTIRVFAYNNPQTPYTNLKGKEKLQNIVYGCFALWCLSVIWWIIEYSI